MGRFNELLEHFVLIYGTDTCYDTRERMILKVNHLRLAYGNDAVKLWLADLSRRMVLPDQLVFDPAGRCGPDCINLFDGLPLTPEEGDVSPALELLSHLTGESAATEQGLQDVFDFVLNWIALPLQQPGAKLASAIVFHGPQGTGKNLFWELVADLYGEYAVVVGQDQLEDKFNDWASRKLFVIGDEVVARQELFHQKNKLKSFITGQTIQINAKMLPLRTETNHVNVVFLSNEQQPLALEEGDRRYLVVYTPAAADAALYDRFVTWRRSGGARRFLAYLLARKLGGFHAHTRPVMTQAKHDLIELGLKPSERFAGEWLAGFLPLPLQVCATEQLYRAFRRWCQDAGERFPPSQIQFSKALARAAGTRLRHKVVALKTADRGRKSVRIWIPEGCGAPAGTVEGDWATDSVGAFEQVLQAFAGRDSSQQEGGRA